MAQARRLQRKDQKSKEEAMRIRNLQYKRLISQYIYHVIVSSLSDGFEKDFYSRETASNVWRTSIAKQVNFKIVVKSLARFNTQFEIKENFKLIKVKNTGRLITKHFGNKSSNYKI